MEGACLCFLKSACQCLVSQAASTATNEMAVQAGVQADAMILAEELGEMHKFLADVEEYDYEEAGGEMEPSGDAEEERRWVDKIRDMACDIEDCLLQLAPHRESPSLWRVRWASLAPRHSIAAELKDLVSQVKRVSEIRERYQRARDRAVRKPAVKPVEEGAWPVEWKVDLGHLLARPDESLLVISVWQMAAGGKATSLIDLVYDDAKMFQCRAWVTATHPMSLTEFLRGLARQLQANENDCPPPVSQSTLRFLGDTERMGTEELMTVVAHHLSAKRYLVVVEDVCTRPTWDWIKVFFPDHRNGSRIIATSQRADVARHCARRPRRSFALEGVKQDDARLYVSSDKVSAIQPFLAFSKYSVISADGGSLASCWISIIILLLVPRQVQLMGKQPAATMAIAKIYLSSCCQLCMSSFQAATSESNVVIKIDPYSQFVGRREEVADLTKRILEDGPDCCPISVYGPSGIGKSLLMRKVVYDGQGISRRFERLAWITLVHPFNQEEFQQSIISQFQACSPGWRKESGSHIEDMAGDKLATKMFQLMKVGRSLVILDGLSEEEEWDQVKSCLWSSDGIKDNCTIVVTTTNPAVAHHCSGNRNSPYKLNPLDSAAVRQLFYHKVFKRDGLIELHEQMDYLANRIIEKCVGDLRAIIIISGLLGTKARTLAAWERVRKRYDLELENNPGLGVANAAGKLSYDDLPSHMKYLLQYLSIFPRGYNLMRRRLATAWVAEIYNMHERGNNAEELEKIFDGLITRGMIHPLKRVEITGGRVNGCHVGDVFQQLGDFKAKTGDWFHILDDHSVNRNPAISQPRHLVIKSGWIRHEDEFKKIDHSCARSLTVFGEWSSFFISPSMRLLRVLDLEDTTGLVEHDDLEKIGEFQHLKYLGLRNTGITRLPNSLGKLQCLEVLDIRGTYIAKLPSTVIHLARLCHLRGGTMAASMEDNAQRDFTGGVTRCCPQSLQNATLSAFCKCLLPTFQRKKPHGVHAPKNIGKLKFIITLGTIDVAGSRSVMKEIQKLTQLQRLGFTGVTYRNSKHLCSILERLQNLRSLMVHSGDSLGGLDIVSSPPRHLETLKLYGTLGTLPRWIKTLHNLQKLCLRTTLLGHDAVQIIAKLPKLIMLHLLAKSIVVEEMEFQSDAFPKLELLQLDRLENLVSVSFPGGALPNLEVLQVDNCNLLRGPVLRQFHKLPKIKKILLDGCMVFKKQEERKLRNAFMLVQTVLRWYGKARKGTSQ
nr:disease resistance protein RGA5-like [Aegilops tauschii subsp. strangulata]